MSRVINTMRSLAMSSSSAAPAVLNLSAIEEAARIDSREQRRHNAERGRGWGKLIIMLMERFA